MVVCQNLRHGFTTLHRDGCDSYEICHSKNDNIIELTILGALWFTEYLLLISFHKLISAFTSSAKRLVEIFPIKIASASVSGLQGALSAKWFIMSLEFPISNHLASQTICEMIYHVTGISDLKPSGISNYLQNYLSCHWHFRSQTRCLQLGVRRVKYDYACLLVLQKRIWKIWNIAKEKVD